MKISKMVLFKSAMLLGVALVLHCGQAIAQDGGRSRSSSGTWITAKQAKEAKAKEGIPGLTKYELAWASIETHQHSTLEVLGKDYKFSQEFQDGEHPYFNAFEEELKPGKYTYAICFIPNGIGEFKRTMADIVSTRKDLLKRREEAMRAGDRAEAKTLYAQSNELRTEATELQRKHTASGKPQPYEFIKKTGQITVDENGVVKIFDAEKFRQEAKARATEKLKALRARAGTEEESSNEIGDY